jgi:hypothetical protein
MVCHAVCLTLVQALRISKNLAINKYLTFQVTSEPCSSLHMPESLPRDINRECHNLRFLTSFVKTWLVTVHSKYNKWTVFPKFTTLHGRRRITDPSIFRFPFPPFNAVLIFVNLQEERHLLLFDIVMLCPWMWWLACSKWRCMMNCNIKFLLAYIVIP